MGQANGVGQEARAHSVPLVADIDRESGDPDSGHGIARGESRGTYVCQGKLGDAQTDVSDDPLIRGECQECTSAISTLCLSGLLAKPLIEWSASTVEISPTRIGAPRAQRPRLHPVDVAIAV
jgi:hypothetical protein